MLTRRLDVGPNRLRIELCAPALRVAGAAAQALEQLLQPSLKHQLGERVVIEPAIGASDEPAERLGFDAGPLLQITQPGRDGERFVVVIE